MAPPSKEEATLLALPFEILNLIFDELYPNDMENLVLTCRAAYNVAAGEALPFLIWFRKSEVSRGYLDDDSDKLSDLIWNIQYDPGMARYQRSFGYVCHTSENTEIWSRPTPQDERIKEELSELWIELEPIADEMRAFRTQAHLFSAMIFIFFSRLRRLSLLWTHSLDFSFLGRDLHRLICDTPFDAARETSISSLERIEIEKIDEMTLLCLAMLPNLKTLRIFECGTSVEGDTNQLTYALEDCGLSATPRSVHGSSPKPTLLDYQKDPESRRRPLVVLEIKKFHGKLENLVAIIEGATSLERVWIGYGGTLNKYEDVKCILMSLFNTLAASASSSLKELIFTGLSCYAWDQPPIGCTLGLDRFTSLQKVRMSSCFFLSDPSMDPAIGTANPSKLLPPTVTSICIETPWTRTEAPALASCVFSGKPTLRPDSVQLEFLHLDSLPIGYRAIPRPNVAGEEKRLRDRREFQGWMKKWKQLWYWAPFYSYRMQITQYLRDWPPVPDSPHKYAELFERPPLIEPMFERGLLLSDDDSDWYDSDWDDSDWDDDDADADVEGNDEYQQRLARSIANGGT